MTRPTALLVAMMLLYGPCLHWIQTAHGPIASSDWTIQKTFAFLAVIWMMNQVKGDGSCPGYGLYHGMTAIVMTKKNIMNVSFYYTCTRTQAWDCGMGYIGWIP